MGRRMMNGMRLTKCNNPFLIRVNGSACTGCIVLIKERSPISRQPVVLSIRRRTKAKMQETRTFHNSVAHAYTSAAFLSLYASHSSLRYAAHDAAWEALEHSHAVSNDGDDDANVNSKV